MSINRLIIRSGLRSRLLENKSCSLFLVSEPVFLYGPRARSFSILSGLACVNKTGLYLAFFELKYSGWTENKRVFLYCLGLCLFRFWARSFWRCYRYIITAPLHVSINRADDYPVWVYFSSVFTCVARKQIMFVVFGGSYTVLDSIFFCLMRYLWS